MVNWVKLVSNEALQKGIAIVALLGFFSWFFSVNLNPIGAPIILRAPLENILWSVLGVFVLIGLVILLEYVMDKLHTHRARFLQYFVVTVFLIGIGLGMSVAAFIFNTTWFFSPVITYLALFIVVWFWEWLL